MEYVTEATHITGGSKYHTYIRRVVNAGAEVGQSQL